MTRSVFINHLAYALGDKPGTVEQAEQNDMLLSPASALREVGFARHHICSNKTTTYDLAYRCVRNIHDDLGNIDAIIYATCIPSNGTTGAESKFRETRDVKYLMDFPASHLQADFGLEKAIVIGLNQQACTGMLGSIRLARNFLVSEPEMTRILCVTADRFPEGSLYEQAYNLISDGAAACVVSTKAAGFRVLAFHGITNGAMVMASNDQTVGCYFSYAHQVIHRTLHKAGLAITDIDWIVPQNTNMKAWQILSRIFDFDYGRVYFPTINDVAHVISGDNVINLKKLLEEGKLKSGERILLFMAGYGMNWQCIILERE